MNCKHLSYLLQIVLEFAKAGGGLFWSICLYGLFNGFSTGAWELEVSILKLPGNLYKKLYTNHKTLEKLFVAPMRFQEIRFETW
jgi:hypothetical protein